MKIELNINGATQPVEVNPGETLLKTLRAEGYFGVKHGCETGECGACTVLVDGKPANACVTLAAQVEGHTIETIEAVGEHPEQGWKHTDGLHPLQTSFVDSGAIQCGFCTPGMVLAAKELLAREPNPSEEQVRDVLSGVLCRCTGYVKPVQAVLHAAAVLRGEAEPGELISESAWAALFTAPDAGPEGGGEGPVGTAVRVLPKVVVAPQTEGWRTVGKPEPKVDAVKLVQGKPAFTADIEKRGMLVAKILKSPLAHARIKQIDASKARALEGSTLR